MNRQTFEALLETARVLRRERRERPARALLQAIQKDPIAVIQALTR